MIAAAPADLKHVTLTNCLSAEARCMRQVIASLTLRNFIVLRISMAGPVSVAAEGERASRLPFSHPRAACYPVILLVCSNHMGRYNGENAQSLVGARAKLNFCVAPIKSKRHR